MPVSPTGQIIDNVDTTGKPIFNQLTSADLLNQGTINLPNEPQDTKNYLGMVTGGNTEYDSGIKWFKDLLSSYTPPPSSVDAYNKAYASSGIEQAQTGLSAEQRAYKASQAELGAIQAQLQGLQTEATATPNQIQQEFAGRGATKGGVAPIETARLRDIALRALDLQAQGALALAKVQAQQGNVELAQQTVLNAQKKLDQVFQLQQEDINRRYDFEKEVRGRVFEFLNEKDKARLTAIQKEEDHKRALELESVRQKGDLEKIKLQQSSREITSPTGGGVLSTLPVSIQGKIIASAEKFGTSDIVKKFNATVDSINVVNGIDPKSKNPADHQAIVYSFAKALDPDSAVREGEYATIKKYAQSLVNRYGKEITNALSGTGFLSSTAISNIQKTMNDLYSSRKPQYDNAFTERARTIDNIAGKPVASEILTDFSSGVNLPQAVSTVTEPEKIFDEIASQPTGYWKGLWNAILGR